MAQAVRRTCVGCRTVREQQALIRITADEAGNLLVNPRSGVGRGAYVCPSPVCLAEAWRRKAFSRAMRRDLPGASESVLRERFGVELRRRGVAPSAVPAAGPPGGRHRQTSWRRHEASAPPDEAGNGRERRHRQHTRRPSGGWDGRR